MWSQYRRTVFIGVTPLLGSGNLRTSLCSFLSIVTVAFVREASPYRENITNILAVVANYQILITFIGAVVLEADSLESFGLSQTSLGFILLAVNVLIIVLSAWWCRQRTLEEGAQREWRAPFSAEDADLVRRIMIEEVKDGDGGKAGMLQRYLLKSNEVQLLRPIGSGSFGDVFEVEMVYKFLFDESLFFSTSPN